MQSGTRAASARRQGAAARCRPRGRHRAGGLPGSRPGRRRRRSNRRSRPGNRSSRRPSTGGGRTGTGRAGRDRVGGAAGRARAPTRSLRRSSTTERSRSAHLGTTSGVGGLSRRHELAATKRALLADQERLGKDREVDARNRERLGAAQRHETVRGVLEDLAEAERGLADAIEALAAAQQPLAPDADPDAWRQERNRLTEQGAQLARHALDLEETLPDRSRHLEELVRAVDERCGGSSFGARLAGCPPGSDHRAGDQSGPPFARTWPRSPSAAGVVTRVNTDWQQPSDGSPSRLRPEPSRCVLASPSRGRRMPSSPRVTGDADASRGWPESWPGSWPRRLRARCAARPSIRDRRPSVTSTSARSRSSVPRPIGEVPRPKLRRCGRGSPHSRPRSPGQR